MMCWCAVKKLRLHAELIEWFLKLRTFFRFFFKTQNTRLLSCCTRFVEHRGRQTSADSGRIDKAHTDTQRSALTGVRTIACRDVDWNDCSTHHPPPPLPRMEYDDQETLRVHPLMPKRTIRIPDEGWQGRAYICVAETV